MVSVFGGYGRGPRGPAGPVGPKGKDGKDGLQLLGQWFPKAILRTIQEYSEKSCFLLEELDNDIIKEDGVIVKWEDRSELSWLHGIRQSLFAVRGSKDLKTLPDKK